MLTDPVYSMARVLRPFTGFETRYQGQLANIPVAFPGTLDRQAGKTGFDPNLLAGLPIQLGSRVLIWIPSVVNVAPDDEATVPLAYEYLVMFRMRSNQDYVAAFEANVPRNQIGAYHLARNELGAPADQNDATTGRIVIPAAQQTIAFEQSEPSTSADTTGDGTIHLRGQLIVPCAGFGVSGGMPAPFLPPPNSATAKGAVNQGIFSDGDAGTTGGPVYHPFWFDAEGDEMIIFARRAGISDTTLLTWDFTDGSLDRGFSNTYGSNNGQRPPIETMGIFVFTGTP